MKKYNLVAVFDPSMTRWLMCRRRKPPFQGLLNLVGGKIEPGESSGQAAARELFEETGLSGLNLTHVMDLVYHQSGVLLEVFACRLSAPAGVSGDENELMWVSLRENFFDAGKYAGTGNLGHILAQCLPLFAP